MNKVQAIVKYMNKIDESILAGYEDADEYVYINDTDPDLQKWRIKMPKPPEWHLIDGFGLPAREQKFQYEKYPEKLKQLEDDIRSEILRSKKDSDSKDAVERMIYDRKWEVLDFGRDQYADIIKWIKRQWFHRLYGKWCFIKGKPTYLDPFHWTFLNYYSIEGGTDRGNSPEYRWRDMKWYKSLRYAMTTTETVDYDEKGNPIVLEDGTLQMRDVGSRTCLGILVNKGRRMGDSSKTKSVEIDLATSNEEFMCASQADTDLNMEGLYNKLVRFSFHKLPFFFMPITPSSKTSRQISLRDTTAEGGLKSYITFRASGETAYDGSRINFYHADEPGKTKNANIKKRHEIVARTLTPGVKIRGSMIYTSTVEEIDSEVGKVFEDLSMESMFEDRGIDGRTKTGLFTIYFSASESYEGFIDPWGYPIIENPTDPEVIANMAFIERNDKGEIMGIREYLEKKEQEFIDRDDLVGLSSWQRKNPTSFRSCFSNASFNLMFDRIKLQGVLAKLKFGKNRCIRGDFVDSGNHNIQFVPMENGPFVVSMQLPSSMSSRIIHDGRHFRPAFNDYAILSSADPYRISQTDSRRKSLGSGCWMWKHDPDLDTIDKPVSEWQSKQIVATYLDRPKSLDEYCNKLLMACIYYNSPIYPENNISVVQEYFIRRGYGGYLLYDINIQTGKRKENAGWTTGGRGGAKEELFNLGGDFVNLHIERCAHPEVVEEFLNIKSLDDLKNRDLLVAIFGVLKAEKSLYVDRMRRFSTAKVDISGFYPK